MRYRMKSIFVLVSFSVLLSVLFPSAIPASTSPPAPISTARVAGISDSRTLGLDETPLVLAASTTADSPDKIPRITAEELKRLMENRADIVIVDNQPKAAYDLEHIKGAINLPWATEIEQEDTWQVPLDKPLIFYCACTHEEDAGDVAVQLIKKFGYKNIKLLEGGWSRWQESGYPTEKGKGK
jgi:rhodanese-related sulfurtransferase